MGRLNDGNDLQSIVARLGNRIRIHDGWRLAQRTLPMALLAGLLVAIAGRFWPIANLLLWTLAPLPLWAGIVAVLAWLRPLPDLAIARRADAQAGLKERLSTALALSEERASTSGSHFDPNLLARQRTDALTVGADLDPAQIFPLRWQRRPLGIAGALAIFTVILFVVPNPMDGVLAERAAVARAAAEEAARLEDLSEEIAAAETLTPEERAELIQKLQETADALRANQGDREEALADLSALEAEIRRRLDASPAPSLDALAALAAQIEALAGTTDEDTNGSEEMAETLEALAETIESLSAEEQEALAQALAQMAGQAAQAGAADLAQALASLAQAAQSGDSAAAVQAARGAAASMSAANAAAAAQAQLQQALDQIDQGRQTVAQAGAQPGSAVAQSQGSNSQNSGQSGQNAGAGSGQGQNPGGGGGADVDRLPGANSSGQANSPRGVGQSGGEDHLDQQVYVPWERRSQGDEELFITGQDTGEGETEIRERPQPMPGVSGPSLIPYQDVYGAYLDSANQALGQEPIPAGLEEYVRAYFTQLEP